MCGIAGFVLDPDRSGAAAANSLLGSLQPRGPDGGWTQQCGRYQLAQTRLAVIDLSERVAYPMPNEDETVWLLFNGEIYDHHIMRRELRARGHRFRTDCDAEVVLHGFEEWGVEIFPRLNGMFAVALVNVVRDELVLARDRTGIKPLVRTQAEPLAFASDAVSLVAAGLSDGALDGSAVTEFLAFHYVPAPKTGIEGLVQVEPGTAVCRRGDGTTEIRRWTPEPFDRAEPRVEVPLDEVDETLRCSVARQLVADVDVGVFLSSGIDSSLVLAYAVEVGVRPTAFTTGFRDFGDYDESARAVAYAKAMGVAHEYNNLQGGFASAIASVGRAYDQPFADASAIAMLQVAELARSRVTVALSGTGGDDLFAGYYRHRAHKLHRAMACVPASLRRRIAEAPRARGGERRTSLTLARSYISRLADAGAGDALHQYLSLVGSLTSPAGYAAVPLAGDLAAARRAVAERHGLELANGQSKLRQFQRFEMATYVAGDLLTKDDRATMAFGLEARVPLLDKELVALADRMPDRQKMSLRGGKLPLRSLAKRKLPAPFSSRARKRGFAVPLQALFEGAWRAEAVDWLSSTESSVVDGAEAAKLVTRTPAVATDVWTVSVLVAWEQRIRDARLAAQRLSAGHGAVAVRPRCTPPLAGS